MSYTIRDGGLATKDPADVKIYVIDWDEEALSASVQISTSTFTIVGIRGDVVTTPLSADNASVMTGDRKTQVRLSAGAAGSKWRIHNRIVTNESPAQTVERSFFLRVEDR